MSESRDAVNEIEVFASIIGSWSGTETIYDEDNQVISQQPIHTTYFFDPVPVKRAMLGQYPELDDPDFKEHFGNDTEYLEFTGGKFWKTDDRFSDDGASERDEIIGYWHSKFRKYFFKGIRGKSSKLEGWEADGRHDFLGKTLLGFWEDKEDLDSFWYMFGIVNEDFESSTSHLNKTILHYKNNRLFRRIVIDQSKQLV